MQKKICENANNRKIKYKSCMYSVYLTEVLNKPLPGHCGTFLVILVIDVVVATGEYVILDDGSSRDCILRGRAGESRVLCACP